MGMTRKLCYYTSFELVPQTWFHEGAIEVFKLLFFSWMGSFICVNVNLESKPDTVEKSSTLGRITKF